MESVPKVLARYGGRATFGELVAATSRRRVAAAVKSGAIERAARGVYVRPGKFAAQRVALAYDGVLSHASAAEYWELPLLAAPDLPHVTVPPTRHKRSGPAAVLHWAEIDPEDLPVRTTSLLRTVMDCARTLPFGEGLAIADRSLTKGSINRSDLVAAAARMRGPGTPKVRRVAAAANAWAASFLESVLRALLLEAGIEGFEVQVVVVNGAFQARVDLGHRQLRIAIEADGYEFHGGRSDFAADCRRYDELVAAGWLVLRFTYEQVLSNPHWVIATIRQAMAHRLAES
jgi:very-short-patch-repair endonuclease